VSGLALPRAAAMTDPTPPQLVVVLATGPAKALRAQEALDLVYAGLALDWRVSLLLRGAGLRWLIPGAADPDAGPGARALPVLADFGLERLCVVEDELRAAGLDPATLTTAVEPLDAAALTALLAGADRLLHA
jgi:sulfur relay (sulfurtransferase) DsrF/TusC family protein